MDKINLDNIIDKIYNMNKDEDNNEIFYRREVKKAMKIACQKVLKLAAENAKVEYDYCWDGENENYGPTENVNKQSILDAINLIE